MNKILRTLIASLTGLLLLTSFATAQTDTNQTPAAKWYEYIINWAPTNIDQLTIAAYPQYSPDLVVNGENQEWGYGVALLYHVTDGLDDKIGVYAGTELCNFGGDFYAATMDVTIKARVKIGGVLYASPFAFAGPVFTLSDKVGNNDESVGAEAGAGLAIHLFKPSKNTSVSLLAAYKHWMPWGVDSYIGGLTGNIKFK